jgi:hypothetical protein
VEALSNASNCMYKVQIYDGTQNNEKTPYNNLIKDRDRPGANCWYKYTYIRHEPSCEMN